MPGKLVPAPVIIAMTVNNRPRYLKETLESWSRVRGVGEHLMLFSCEPGCDEATDLCRAADFAPGVIARNGRRLGVLANPWAAFDRAFCVSADAPVLGDFAVLAEDDMIVSADVLEWFTWCQRYRDDPGVLAVTAYQRLERPGGLSGAGDAEWDYHGAHFWVWGTWRDRWETVLRDDWDFTYAENGGGPLQRGWDWRIRNLYVLGRGMRVIAPSLSRVQHIGRNGGTHCTPDQFEGLLSGCFAGLDVPPQDYQEVSQCPAR
jgi:hypothetical protein